MDIKLEINPEDIQKHIIDAIMNSTIGVELHKVIEDKVKGIVSYNYSFKQTLETLVSREIEIIVRNVIQEKYKDTIRGVVEEKVNAEFTKDLIDGLWDAWVSNNLQGIHKS